MVTTFFYFPQFKRRYRRHDLARLLRIWVSLKRWTRHFFLSFAFKYLDVIRFILQFLKILQVSMPFLSWRIHTFDHGVDLSNDVNIGSCRAFWKHFSFASFANVFSNHTFAILYIMYNSNGNTIFHLFDLFHNFTLEHALLILLKALK